MAYTPASLLQVCTRCRIRSLIHDLRVARLPRTPFSTRQLASAALNGTPRRLELERSAIRAIHPSQRGQSRGFTAVASTWMPRTRDRRSRRESIEDDVEHEPQDTMENLAPHQQMQLIEILYASQSITWDEWRAAVFSHLKLPDVSEVAEEERAVEDRVRHFKSSYGAESTVPEALLNEQEKKVWERLFGSGTLRALEEIDLGALEGENEQTTETAVLREGENGLEEVEIEEDEDAVLDRQFVSGDERLAEDMQHAMATAEEEYEDPLERGEEGDTSGLKSHPLTIANRFGTFPSTIQLSKTDIIDPISAVLAGIPPVHIAETADRVFGGPGLPYSTSTPHRGKLMQQKPIPLDAYQSHMSAIEGDAYMAAIFPGILASVTSVLTETRKRLGTPWAEQLVRKASEGNLKILDAGGSGAGVLAVRALLRAEWERMHEDGSMDLARADGRVGGPGASPPLGSATVLTGSDALRLRASKLLENTTFIPRLPDYIHTEEAKMHGKFDIVIAPHTLWQLKEDYVRKMHVQNLWSLLSASEGVLILLEKGIARGFELIAGAREMLLHNRIANPNGPEDVSEDVQPLHRFEAAPREPGMIIAPCTNHSACPMYIQKGIVKGRRDICSFAQRYNRPPFLQKIFGARARNHEDVEFSYLSVMRGRDLREVPSSDGTPQIQQDVAATDRAFKGFGELALASNGNPFSAEAVSPINPPHSLSLPRAVFPPLKRKGHVIIDVCTPAGTLERWTVPRSFSKQAFRDARKSAWGDLWALGAKTRVPRNVKAGAAKADLDVEGRVVGESRKGRKVKGIRDKRDKKGQGNGRKKYQEEA